MQTISELANSIINEIEKEDYIYSIKNYGCYKTYAVAKDFQEI